MRSGMPAAMAFMRQRGSVRHLSSEFPLSRLYAGRANVLDTTVSFTGKDPRRVLASCYAEGYRFVLIAGGKLVTDPPLLALLKPVEPVFTAPHSFHLTSYEHFVARGEVLRSILSDPEQLQIYDIQQVLGERAMSVQASGHEPS